MNIPQDMIVGSIHETKFSGKVKVLDYKNKNSVEILFIDTGNKKTVPSRLIRLRTIKDEFRLSVCGVGYFGIGIHKSKKDGKHTIQYSTWRSMIRRCYYKPYSDSNPTYRDCTVCKEWHNFQKFAEWLNENYPNDGKKYELDKDIKIEGNKHYSPEGCLFVSKKENTIKAKAELFLIKSPLGEVKEIYNMSEFCRRNELNPSCMSEVIHGKQKNHKGWVKV